MALKKKLYHLVDAAGGLCEFQMLRVRDEYGFKRLGPGVSERITEKLADEGMGHLSGGPFDLPLSQSDRVYIYIKQSPVGKVIEDVLHPTPKGVERLLELASGDAQAVLDDIRSLVCAASAP